MRRRHALVFVEDWISIPSFKKHFAIDSDICFSLVWMRVVKRLSGRWRVISTKNWFIRTFFFLVFKRFDKSGKGFNSNGRFVTRAIVIGEGFGGGSELFGLKEVNILGERNFFIFEP